MRKFLLIFILSFLFIIKTNALEKFYLGEKITGMYIEVVDGNDFYNGPGTVLYKENGEYVYCINPFLTINTEDYYNLYDYNNYLFNLTDEQIEKINLLSYFGYGYGNHQDLKWYGVTQFLIWKTITNGDIYFTDKYMGSRIEAYTDEITDIESLVNSYLTLPSFSSNEFKYTINSNYEIIDSNNVLNNYNIIESDIDAIIEDNKLIINTKEEGSYKVKFGKKINYNKNTHLYYLSDYQSLISPGSINDIEFTLNIEVKSGSIIINKLDSENINRREATLFKAKYGIFKDNELINVVETDELGKAYINNLPLGKYYVKEIEPSTGYNIDNNIYEIVLDYDENEKEVNLLEEVIYGNLIINKYYGGNGVYHVEEEPVFEIYDVNNNLIDSLLASSGSNSIKLEYGNYLIHQKKGISGYKFVDDFNLFINSNDDYIFDLYDELIVDVPNTFKISGNIYLSIILIGIGLIIIIKSKIKIKA